LRVLQVPFKREQLARDLFSTFIDAKQENDLQGRDDPLAELLQAEGSPALVEPIPS
jgi:hypothetical protein